MDDLEAFVVRGRAELIDFGGVDEGCAAAGEGFSVGGVHSAEGRGRG